MNIHMPCDEIGRKIIQDKIDDVCLIDKEISLERLNNMLNDIPEIKNAKTDSVIRIGNPLSKAGKVIFSHGRGTNGGVEIAKAYYKAGFDTVIYIHISYGDYLKLRKTNERNLIITGHIASDSVGINPFIQELEKKGIVVDTIGGIIKNKR
jgi:putative NIF3 family GTP cyclohydrolase 1 type 2